MTQSAVEYLQSKLGYILESRPSEWDKVIEVLNQAKKMEAEQRQQERMYSEEDMRLAITKARDISDGKDCFDAEGISGCTEVCTYGWKFNMSEDLIIEQIKQK